MTERTNLKSGRRQTPRAANSEGKRFARVTTTLESDTIEALDIEARRQGLVSRGELIRNLVKSGLRRMQSDRLGEEPGKIPEAAGRNPRQITAESLKNAAAMARDYYSTNPDAKEWAEFAGDSPSYDQG